MQLRISGGSARGRILFSGKGLATRPTPASVREALTNILRERLHGASVLDLFAGYGSAGLELLSQGAAEAVFVERDGGTVRLLKRNVELLGFADRTEVWQSGVHTALDRLQADGRRFDLVFADPPYREGLAVKSLEYLAVAPELLAEGGLLIIQHSTREPLAETNGPLTRTREKVYGDTVLSFYEEKAADEGDRPGDV